MISQIIANANAWPQSHLKKYGLETLELPPDGGQWTLWEVCPVHGVSLRYTAPSAHTCPIDGKIWSGWPYDQVVYDWRADKIVDSVNYRRYNRPMQDPHVAAVRAFNRFYTRQIGLLSEGHLGSPFSLTEVRVLYEIAHRERPTASEIARDLALDAGYLSRILLKFQKRRLLTRERSATDGRQWHVALTKQGRQVFAPLDRDASRQLSTLLQPLPPARRHQLVDSMQTVQQILTGIDDPTYALRPHRPGDIGWVIHRHGVLYFQEYGWDERFEALVADIAAKFVQNFDPARERCWIAEKDGAIVGSVFLVRQTDTVAKLRLLLVEPSARGLGLGKRLVQECIDFARAAGYSEITLWTQAELLAARHIYEKAGFRLAGVEKHHHFGPEMVGEVWNMTL